MNGERSPVQIAILREARRQRAWRLRRAKQERWRFRLRRLRRAFLSLAAFLVATIGASFALNGLPDGTYLSIMALSLVVFFVLALYPSTPRPRAEDLAEASLPELAGSAELWLETRRRALPSPALDAIDLIGARLEQLAPQLETLGENEPAAREVRKLLTEHLPGLVNSYTRIPSSLRGKPHAGSTPEAQLVDGLQVIASEIETMSEHLARNELDALAVRGRFLETRYITTARDD
ncbi:hypothetical protein [Novosphingobium album (ex Liu et al. 2023)]|uniref:Uncharacterized protein n=1 Tax=Novosphingobium album (ex Liu et al. 2023) TaxID=3031130 RepID=A0ABT5WN26_9SPHN|nr:hypothetical protein [Novosphingobium album (ex Liu et al. 2023)]MDE8650338.1 hypothetical protein [Novosphingobium album (ex Liu et al. 2023)]